MFCWKCGEPIDDGEELCEVCGAKQGNHAATGTDTASKSVTVKGDSAAKLKKILGADTAVRTVADKVVETMAEVGKDVLDNTLKEVKKTMLKKAKKGTHKAMVKLKMTKETPLDKAEKILKKIKK